MFSIYGINGQTFRGPLENLVTVQALAPVNHPYGIAREGEELGPEHLHFDAAAAGGGAASYQQAAQSYRETLEVPIERGPLYHAYQVMTREVLTLTPDTRVDAAWRFITQHKIGQAPVLDGARRLVGLVSLVNLLNALNVDQGDARDIMARSVADVMTTPVVSADPVTDIRRVARVLLDYHLTGLPIMNEQNELVGIVTRSDILRAVMNDPPLSLWA